MSAQDTLGNQDKVRRRLRVTGVVQGIGFRPYVYQHAQRHRLAGFVRNSPTGVIIEIEGPRAAVDAFAESLPNEGPPLMRVAAIEAAELPPAGDEQFVILASEAGANAFTLVPPDICVCAQCLAETRDAANRRFEYPFTNCTNCGPRYSIIVDIPYDRPKTTMAEFMMCDRCRAEYENPADRRFHAQPNACPVCGPRLRLMKADGTRIDAASTREVLEEVARSLLAGRIVGWKGLGGYQLACDARDEEVVAALRRRKHRNEKPFAIMVEDLVAAERLCFVDEAERSVLLSAERPIVLLKAKPEAAVAPGICCGNPNIGLMLPCTPMHDLLLRVLHTLAGRDVPLVMTSGNLSEEPIAIDDEEALRTLAGVADLFVPHNRRIHTRVDDSVVHVYAGEPLLLRRARGYAPQPIWLGLGETEVLGCGAQQKSTLCLTRGGFALPSQHLGDLENYETLRFFEETLARMRRLFHAEPTIVAHDLHPDYLSTQFALKMPAARRIGVQHHHAHIAACMAEHQLEGEVIGIAWDGTGLGTDNTIWGGEFLVADLAGFERAAHLRSVLMAGGDAAVREPWRLARAYLLDAFDGEIPIVLPPLEKVRESSIRTVDAMLKRRIQVVETTSCGRLFDAVASLAGLHHTVSFEGQAAMALEALASRAAARPYAFVIADAATNKAAQVDMRPMIREIVADRMRGIPAAEISARFHQTLTLAALEVCRRIRSRRGLKRVCLGGGCFQNMRLLDACVESLRADGFDVYFPRSIPANDGGIALGQAAIACELVRRGS